MKTSILLENELQTIAQCTLFEVMKKCCVAVFKQICPQVTNLSISFKKNTNPLGYLEVKFTGLGMYVCQKRLETHVSISPMNMPLSLTLS